MLIISKKRLQRFWETAEGAGAADALSAWHQVVVHADWTSWADLKTTFPKASKVGDCVVFNIRGNEYRLVTRLRYQAHKVFILEVMTHKVYNDQAKWQEECGCFTQIESKPEVAEYIARIRAARKRRRRS